MSGIKELMEKAKLAKSAENLVELAKGEGIELSEQNAQIYFDFLNTSGELSEADLDIVAGGKGDPKPPKPKYHEGQRCLIYWPTTMNYTPGVITVVETGVYSPELGTRYQVTLAVQSGAEILYPFYLETMPNVTVYD